MCGRCGVRVGGQEFGKGYRFHRLIHFAAEAGGFFPLHNIHLRRSTDDLDHPAERKVLVGVAFHHAGNVNHHGRNRHCKKQRGNENDFQDGDGKLHGSGLLEHAQQGQFRTLT